MSTDTIEAKFNAWRSRKLFGPAGTHRRCRFNRPPPSGVAALRQRRVRRLSRRLAMEGGSTPTQHAARLRALDWLFRARGV